MVEKRVRASAKIYKFPIAPGHANAAAVAVVKPVPAAPSRCGTQVLGSSCWYHEAAILDDDFRRKH